MGTCMNKENITQEDCDRTIRPSRQIKRKSSNQSFKYHSLKVSSSKRDSAKVTRSSPTPERNDTNKEEDRDSVVAIEIPQPLELSRSQESSRANSLAYMGNYQHCHVVRRPSFLENSSVERLDNTEAIRAILNKNLKITSLKVNGSKLAISMDRITEVSLDKEY